MNPDGRQITLSTAVTGFLIEKEGLRLSPNTIRNYRLVFRRAIAYLGADTFLADINHQDIMGFMAHLANLDRAPDGVAPRPRRRLSKKTLKNHHTALSSLWTWALARGYVSEHVLREVDAPRPEKKPILPFSNDDIRALLGACEQGSPYEHWKTGRKTSNARPTALRDRAIVLLLFDTGIRASELCKLTQDDVDMRNHKITVQLGKGDKGRSIPIDPATTRAIWEYVARERAEDIRLRTLFLTESDGAMNRNTLYKLIRRLGKRANVRRAYPHRFRHTFAISFLRNGGNIYALREILGHSSLEMVQRYLEIVQSDIDAAHQTASPVANLSGV
jgi:site-specific recombinase XerD